MNNTLFELPPKKPRITNKRGPRTQRERCYRCDGSSYDKSSGDVYCNRFDICLYTDEDSLLKICNNNQPIKCDGKKWTY